VDDGQRRRWPWIWLAILSCLLAVAAVWVFFAGRFLVRSQTPARADAVVVLSGDPLGNRLRTGAQVFNATGSDRLIVFIPPAGTLYDQRPVAERYLRRHGVELQAVRFVPAEDSTAEEAGTVAAYAHRCGWSSIEVATSPFHTRRAGFLFGQALGDDSTVTTVASGEPYDAAHWWRDPGDRESTLLEWTKLVSSVDAWVSSPSGNYVGMPC
jgi:uncharacterized SAM-binding protein YcdF (DUF218 family)